MRRAAAFLLAAFLAAPAMAQSIRAEYAEPTTRYDHGILGDAVEWGALRVTDASGTTRLIRLPESMVFEDIAPRLADVTGDGQAEVVVIETHLSYGARLAVYDSTGQALGSTDFIGRSHRWLAPAGIGDLDGDGRIELAYVDRPHLAKTLRIVRLQGGKLVEVAALAGLSNHQIGWDHIDGGLRDCGDGAELVLASGDWRDLMAVRLAGGKLTSRRLGAYSANAITSAMACQ